MNLRHTYMESWLRLLVLCGIIGSLLAQDLNKTGPVTSDIGCPYEPFPTTLNTLSGLQFNGEVYIHNQFYTNFVRGQSHLITFTIQEESAFRMYVQPHYVDIDIWLFAEPRVAVTHTSDYSLADEVIFATLPAGSYRIQLFFFNTFVDACPTTLTELSIIPTSRLMERIGNFSCPSTPQFPTLDMSNIDVNGFSYDSSNDATVYNVQNPTDGRYYNFIQSYNFTLPQINQNTDTWEIEAVINFNFPTSGLGLLVLNNDAPIPTTLACYDQGNCSIASHKERGQSTLKALLAPQNYTLWIYDVPGERNLTLNQCSPFSLSVNIRHADQEEGFLNCYGEELPLNLNTPGLMDDWGFLYFREDVALNLAQPTTSIKFSVQKDSYFRAFTVENRIDIDLRLYGNGVNAYGYAFGGVEEGIQAFLPVGNYTLDFILYGKYSNIFCETVLFELAIAPRALYNGTVYPSTLCPAGQATSTPDLSGLSTITYPFKIPYGTYLLNYNGNYNQQIVKQSFVLPQASYITVNLGSNFLLGDVRVWLSGNNTNYLGYHRRNMHYLDMYVLAGNYNLTIVTGDVQTGAITGFPPCTVYSFSMSISAYNSSTPNQCLSYRRFPSILNTPENLLTSPKVHIQEYFLIPPIPSLYVAESVNFNVTTNSYFRLYTGPHHIDIDFKLTENGNTVAQRITFNSEEPIAWLLKPGNNYTLTITYYKWAFVNHPNDPCYIWDGELSIVPQLEQQDDTCNTIYLPSDLPTLSSTAPVDIDDTFWFPQPNVTNDILVHFSIPAGATAFFRAVLTYDFAWTDLALKLDIPGSTDPLTGELEYNKNEISTLTLTGGNYTLHIYEPFRKNNVNIFEWKSCVYFRLRLGLELLLDDVDPMLLSCPDLYLPPVWNSPAFLHNLTGQRVDFDRDVLADVTDRTDQFKFTVIYPSIFRLYVPVHLSLDIDVKLNEGTRTVINRVSYGLEEAIVYNLTAGLQYTVIFTYYGAPPSLTLLPPASACTAFRTQISIYPLHTLNNVPPLSQSCSTSFAPAIATGTIDTTEVFTRSLDSATTFAAYTVFLLQSTYLFTARLDQNEVSSGIGMLLRSVSPITKIYQPLYFLNHIYLNEVLPPGTYNLSFHDPFAGQASLFHCANYTLTYSLNVTTDFPPDYCGADLLPSNLYSYWGGSTPIGGPQEYDGSIHLYSNKFVMQTGVQYRDNYIEFMVYNKTYLRIFVSVMGGNTITSSLYQDTGANVTATVPIAQTIAKNANDRSNVWVLSPQSKPYLFDLQFTNVDPSVRCNYFTFEFVLEPETRIYSKLACPNPLPYENQQVPAETVNVFSGQDYSTFGSSYIITSDRYLLNTRDGKYRYTMTLTIADNSTIRANIGYDFLINEFVLVLQDQGFNYNISVGQDQESTSTDSSIINFMNNLQVDVPAGTYRLIIYDVGYKNWSLQTFCHYFSFSLSISSNQIAAPRVVQVEPPHGYDLDPTEPLVVSLIFSEQFTVPAPMNNLVTYLTNTNGTYLTGAPTIIYPYSATFDRSVSVLTLTFYGFTFGQTLTLNVNSSVFITNANGTPFQPGTALTQSLRFSMYKCNGCNGHGNCTQLPSGQWTCMCTGNWIGDYCEKCAAGYHGAGTDCVANVPCANNSCNNHGRCNDGAGYPVCQCSTGFTGAACDSCAPGYTGYPNCTFNGTDLGDESEDCVAPLLPYTLNTPAYLNYEGHAHIQGFYFVNQDSRTHSTYFTINQQSAFRIYTEPHAVDVDIWLYQIINGVNRVVSFKIQFGLEESIYTVLDPGDYLIRFNYFFWVKPATDCETFNMELSITPLSKVLSEAQAMSYYCGASSNLPNNSALVVSDVFDLRGTGFAVNAAPGTTPNYFWRLNITIAPPSPTQVASLHATVGYRFLQGDLSILLEAGTAGTHCQNTQFVSITPPTGCAYGDNLINENTLHQYLEAGDYILWVYEPVRQNPNITSCSPFDFSLHIEFVDDEQDIWNCNLPYLPLSLDNSEYTEVPGYVHFNDFFLLDGRNTSFTVTQLSLMRVAIVGIDASVSLYNAGTNTVVPTNGDAQNALVNLNPGVYTLKFTADMFRFCPTLAIEFALAPVNSGLNITCQRTSLPNIQITSFPFIFAPNTTSPAEPTFYAYADMNTPTVQSYQFSLSGPAFFDVGLESDFLRTDLRVQLYLGQMLLATGYHDYNFNHWQQVLEPGNYELRIVLPPGNTSAYGVPSCQQFNFQLRIFYTTNNMPVCYGNFLPYTFNTMRFLGYEGAMNYQSDSWIIANLQSATYHNIWFNVTTRSLIRVYTEPHAVDIDTRLLAVYGNTAQFLTSGSNMDGEESFTYFVDPGTQYILRLEFFAPPGQTFACAAFNMEVEIGTVPARPNCYAGASLWPTNFPSTLTLPYNWNSIDNNMQLYYQQQSKTPISHDMPFTLPTASDFHAEVGYDFLLGDLVLKLYSASTKETFYGYNKRDRNIIHLVNLPKGNYVLTIAEAAVNLDTVVGCSNFTFSVYIDSFSALVSEDKFLIEYHFPGTLNSIPYLNATGSTHLANNYFMFDGTGRHENTTFTITQQSLLRVESMLAESQIASGGREIPGVVLYSGATQQTVGNGSIYTILSPGTYTVAFTPPAAVTEEGDLGVIVTVQLALSPLANVQNDISQNPNPSTCTTTVIGAAQVDPTTGYYHDGSLNGTIAYASLTASYELERIPFTLDRVSVVWLQVGSQFLLDELDLRVFSLNATTLLHGRIRKNLNEIHAALPAGSYYATVSQPSTQPTGVNLDHCGLFSYSLIITDASNENAIVDCTTLNQIPYNLDNNAGGSSPFGGPIASDGTLHFYGTGMHIPQQLTSYINFTISRDSFVSVLTNWPSDVSGITYDISNTTGLSTTPRQNILPTNSRSRLAQYTLPQAPGTPYKLGVSYRLAGMYNCFAYTLQIDIAPASALQSQLQCTNGASAVAIPASIDLSSGQASGTVDSFMQGWNAVTGLSKSVTFSVTGTAVTGNFMFSFNSLVTAYTMKLRNTRTNTDVVTGQVRGQSTPSGNTNVYSWISTNIPVGNYSIIISHPTTNNPLSGATSLCLPFTFTYQIGPQVAISNIDPPSATGLSPTVTLQVSITFSTTPFISGNQRLTSENSAAVASAFYLAGSNGKTVNPTYATARGVTAASWILTFPALGAQGTTFTLSLSSGVLFDGAGNSLTLPNSYRYTTLDCGANGQYNNAGGCVCNPGYAGPACDTCDTANGYTTPTGSPGLCVKNACQPNTCGCLDPPTCHTPLGTCTTNVSGLPVCQCASNYAGEHCEACAPGYFNYSACVRPNCQHGGSFNIDTNQCECRGHWTGFQCDECPSNWAGANCDQCADGYTGSNCDSKSGGDDWSGTKTFLKVMAVLVSVALVAGAAFWFWRRRLSGSRYKLVSRFNMDDDDEEAGHRFLEHDNRLVDDDDELLHDEGGDAREISGDEEPRHQEEEPAAPAPAPAVNLPSPAGSVNSEPFSSGRLIDM